MTYLGKLIDKHIEVVADAGNKILRRIRFKHAVLFFRRGNKWLNQLHTLTAVEFADRSVLIEKSNHLFARLFRKTDASLTENQHRAFGKRRKRLLHRFQFLFAKRIKLIVINGDHPFFAHHRHKRRSLIHVPKV